MVNLFNNSSVSDFRKSLSSEFNTYLIQQMNKYSPENCLKIDLHCHDLNSDVPDELWGRILGLPETWLKTKKLVKQLKINGCDAITVTNHNNARSCWDLKAAGQDVLIAAEFTCYFPEYELFVHVLAYGFNREQENILNKKRQNIYDFVRYTAAQDIPLILPHPLYFYTRNEKIDLDLFEKLAVMFQRFEVLNGQRDLWQSLLTLNWAQSLSAEKILGYAKKHNLNPSEFAVDPFMPKVLTGGSDDHMGIFAGECGSYLYVPDLQTRLKSEKPSSLALEAIKNGNIVPFGHVSENQKLSIALLDYFSQAATKIEDPGLLRILFHRGEASDKVSCFILGNLLLEMKKNKNTRKFFNFIHDALKGKKPGKLIKWKVPKDYQFCIAHLEKIADSKKKSPEEFVTTVNQSIAEMFTELNMLMISRLKKSYPGEKDRKLKSFSTEEITRKFEIPSQLTMLIYGSSQKSTHMSGINFNHLIDKLSFPGLISIILMGATLASTRLLYQNRKFLNDFSDHIGMNPHHNRALYLTDTLLDNNGVSSSLSGKLCEVQRMDYPVDFLICHEDANAEPHLHVIKPLTSFSASEFSEQEFRIPNLLEVARIFYEGGYDRIVCSTEGPMALASLFIKHMFNVPCYFFMHTDWLDFLKHTTDLSHHELDRIRRALRVFYKQYNGVFVLNSDHRDWLTGHEMQLEPDKVLLTAHHTQPIDFSVTAIDKSTLFAGATQDTPVLFIACRLSRENGIFDLPDIIDRARQTIPDLKIVIAGTGPARDELQDQLPDALFLGSLDKQRISELYMGLDLFIFPSRFDTFGNIILESFVYGMPVLAYNCKDSKNIIEHGINGYLVDELEQMSHKIVEFYTTPGMRELMSINAMRCASEYQAGPVMEQFIQDMGLQLPPPPAESQQHRCVA